MLLTDVAVTDRIGGAEVAHHWEYPVAACAPCLWWALPMASDACARPRATPPEIVVLKKGRSRPFFFAHRFPLRKHATGIVSV